MTIGCGSTPSLGNVVGGGGGGTRTAVSMDMFSTSSMFFSLGPSSSRRSQFISLKGRRGVGSPLCKLCYLPGDRRKAMRSALPLLACKTVITEKGRGMARRVVRICTLDYLYPQSVVANMHCKGRKLGIRGCQIECSELDADGSVYVAHSSLV